jgi:heme/copper-type cytochrome/quinol oxidase subunit 2
MTYVIVLGVVVGLLMTLIALIKGFRNQEKRREAWDTFFENIWIAIVLIILPALFKLIATQFGSNAGDNIQVGMAVQQIIHLTTGL